MKYEVLILDWDGTIVPNKPDGSPSKKLIQTMQKIDKKISISTATGRPYSACIKVLRTLNITSPCIFDGGARIVDVKYGKILFEKLLSQDKIKQILKICAPYKYKIISEDDFLIDGDIKVTSSNIRKRPLLCLLAATKEDALKILEELTAVISIVAHPVMSWTKGHIDIHITHAFATKKHGIEKLLEILKVKREKTIGIGDSNNDFPLLESVGLKIAMGNATNELKEIADYVAPPVEQDGVAHVIEKFILK